MQQIEKAALACATEPILTHSLEDVLNISLLKTGNSAVCRRDLIWRLKAIQPVLDRAVQQNLLFIFNASALSPSSCSKSYLRFSG